MTKGWKRIAAWIICMMLTAACIPGISFAESVFTAGSGTEKDPYLIYSEDELNSIRDDLNGYYRLAKDIDIKTDSWVPVGAGPDEPFTGVIDGDGHYISGLDIEGDADTASYLGFVGYNSGTICNITFKDCSLTSDVGGTDKCYQGLISGYNNENAVIRNCDVTGVKMYQFTNSGELFAGAVTGYNEGTVTEVACTGTVSGEHIIHTKVDVGGIAGRNADTGVIEKCYADLNLNSTQNLTKMKMSYWGGLCGYNAGVIRNSFCTGTLKVSSDIKTKGKSYLGGITGILDEGATLDAVYQYTEISGEQTKKGNIFGLGETVDASKAYYIDSNNLTCNAGYPLTTVRMYNQKSYQGYDFENVWFMETGEDGYLFPQLRDLPYAGDFSRTSVENGTAVIEDVLYTGNELEPATVFTVGDKELREEFDYTLRFENNVDAGTGTAVINGIGKYKGEKRIDFVISPADISGRAAELDKTEIPYTGKAIRPQVTVSGLENGRDYTVSYADNVKMGTGKVYVNGTGNYTGQIVSEFVITEPQVPQMTKINGNLYNKYNTIRVSWNKISGVTGYKVMWKKASAVKWNSKRVTGNYATMTKLAAGAKYTVKVVPYVKASGKFYEGKGSAVTVYTLKKVNKPTVKKYSAAKVRVSWNNINGETGYQISRSLKSGGTNVVTTVKTTTGKTKVVKAVKGKTYYYKVRAYKTVNGNKIFGPWSRTYKYTNR